MYSLGKSSFGFLAKLFGVSRTTTYHWVRQVAETIDEPIIADNIQAIEFDEMWHFIQEKKKNLDYQSRGALHRANYCLGARWS